MAGTRRTVPTAQSASSAYGEGGGRKEGESGGVLYLEERELNKEGKEKRKRRNR